MADPAHGFRKVEERRVYESLVFDVAEATFADPDGGRLEREIVRHIGAVAVVPVDGDDVVLVRQFRTPVGQALLEIPAGRRDVQGEAPQRTARRELAEEAGLACESLHESAMFYNSPGFCDELSHLFIAEGLSPSQRDPDGAEERWMTVERVPLSEAVEMIDRGEIRDAKTIIGVLLAARRMGL